MKPNEELFAVLADLLNSHGGMITFPIVMNRHKWEAELEFYGKDDGFDFFVTFTSPKGRMYEFWMTDTCTDVEVYSRNGHLVTAQYPSNSIPLWILDRIESLRDVLDEY